MPRFTVQVRNGDWHYTRTSEPVPFAVAVREAITFEEGFLLQGGQLISIANVDPPRLSATPLSSS
jgi:hypothetical protein